VSEGQELLQLDDSVDQAELKGLIAERDLATIEYRRLAKLLRERSVSQSDVDQARATLDNASAQVASKRALIAKKRITAPFSGRLGIRRVDLGEFLMPGSEVVPLQALDPVYVDFSLPEREFSRLRVGQPTQVRVTAHPDRTFKGEITAVNPGVDQSTRTVRVRATLANPDLLMRPGMFAEVGVLLPARSRVLTLPRTAITYNPYGDSVFRILEQDGQLKVQRKQIRTGDVENGRVEVLEGLAAGDRVVLAGQVKLRNGQAVKIDNAVVPEEGEGLKKAEDVTGRSGS
jgi:membrane fusion protein (multidrug efflux system)